MALHNNDLSTNLSSSCLVAVDHLARQDENYCRRRRACDGQAAAMPSLLFVVLLFNVALLGAAELQYRGYAVADQVCLGAIGLCDRPLWLAAAAALFTAVFMAQKSN
jgi:hypothetical protein